MLVLTRRVMESIVINGNATRSGGHGSIEIIPLGRQMGARENDFWQMGGGRPFEVDGKLAAPYKR